MQAHNDARVAGNPLKVSAILGALHFSGSGWPLDTSLPLHVRGPINQILDLNPESISTSSALCKMACLHAAQVLHRAVGVLMARLACLAALLTHVLSGDSLYSVLVLSMSRCAAFLLVLTGSSPWTCRHSPLGGSDDLERWAGAATESIVSAYRSALQQSCRLYSMNSSRILCMDELRAQ